MEYTSSGFDPDRDCTAHRETILKLTEMEKAIQAEKADRSAAVRGVVEEVGKNLRSIRKEFNQQVNGRCQLMDNKVDLQLKLFQAELESMKMTMKSGLDSVRKLLYVFIGANITMWVTLIGAMIHLAEKH